MGILYIFDLGLSQLHSMDIFLTVGKVLLVLKGRLYKYSSTMVPFQK